MNAVPLAYLEGEGFGTVTANDAQRRSFTLSAGTRLLAIDGANLSIIHEWPLKGRTRGWHASLVDEGLALVSGSDRVTLLGPDGSEQWSVVHVPWAPGGFESGCAWFDAVGRPFAVVPAHGYHGCRIVHLDISTGSPVADAAIHAAPAGVHPIHHPDGWVGLSEGEGQDAARAWWVRLAEDEPRRLDLLNPGWDDLVLADVHSHGDRILTTPHAGGPLTIRSFPGLHVMREVQPPGEDDSWDFSACFVREHIVAGLINETERVVAIDHDGVVEELECGPGWLVPAYDSWLTVDRSVVRRWTLG